MDLLEGVRKRQTSLACIPLMLLTRTLPFRCGCSSPFPFCISPCRVAVVPTAFFLLSIFFLFCSSFILRCAKLVMYTLVSAGMVTARQLQLLSTPQATITRRCTRTISRVLCVLTGKLWCAALCPVGSQGSAMKLLLPAMFVEKSVHLHAMVLRVSSLLYFGGSMFVGRLKPSHQTPFNFMNLTSTQILLPADHLYSGNVQ